MNDCVRLLLGRILFLSGPYQPARMCSGILLAIFLLASPALCEYADGMKAFQRGDYVAALAAFRSDPSAESAFQIATIYENGLGVKEDHEEASKWHLKSSKAGFYQSQHRLAAMYEYGRGVQEDIQQAFNWYITAAKLGHASSQYRVAKMYENGIGVERNLKNSFDWYMRGAKLGNARAQYMVAGFFETGIDVEGVSLEPDLAQTAKWYLKSAYQGQTLSQYAIGKMYMNGAGIAQNPSEGIRWLRKAAENGHARAQMEIDSFQPPPQQQPK